MEAEATALSHLAAAGREPAIGTVRVATTEAMAVFLVMQGLLGLSEQHPGLLIEILGGNRPVDLAGGEADLAVRVTKTTEQSLRVRCIARMSIGLFAAPSYLRARGQPRTPQGLRGHDVLLPSAELGALPEARWLATRPQVRVVFRSSSMPALAAAAAAGVGITALTLPWGDGDSGLDRVMVLDEIPKRPIWLVASPEANTRSAVKLVSERIAAIYARGSS